MKQQQVPRSRPTNNQLLYKAHFRWEHYGHRQVDTSGLPVETEPCASVTAAFLKVLGILQRVESSCVPKRNILQILASNTRRTKVLELSSGTHRIPDELKKHFLTDEHGAQYSTNLDRNRYGNDNNYLFTVIKHDLETLGLCPCLVDVEIIDAKAHGDSQLVTAGQETCLCTNPVAPPSMPAPAAQGECSQLFEALVAAAADATTAELAEADTAAARKAGSGRLNGSQPLPADQPPVRSTPGRKRAPKRVPTGMFSINSSDLMGCGLSNLGNSGLVVGDLDLDRKDEVEQGPLSKRPRMGKDADTVSEQGDTERYLKSLANLEGGAGEGAGSLRRHVPPRQNSVIVENGHSREMRNVRAELQQVQHGQAQLAHILEAHKRGFASCEQATGRTQRAVDLLREDRAQLQSALEHTTKRVVALEGTLAGVTTELTMLKALLHGLTGTGNLGDKGLALEALVQQPQQRQSPAPDAAALRLLADLPLAHSEGAGGLNGLVKQRSPSPAAAVDVGVLPASLNRVPSPAIGAQGTDQLAPIAQLHRTSSMLQRERRAIPRNPSMQNETDGSLGGEGLGEGDPQALVELGSLKFEDSHVIKNLPKFEHFGSLSDLGSLFSVGQGRSGMDVRGNGRQPPRANHSITSPHPLLTANGKKPAAEAKEEGAATPTTAA